MTSKIVFSIAFCSFPNLFLPRTHSPPLSLCLVRSVLSTHVGNFHLFVSSTAAAYISITNVACSRTSVKGRRRGRGNRTWPGWCVECQMRLWFVACPLPNKSNAINSLSRSNRAYQARGAISFPLPVPCTARGCCCCCPLCQILDTCPGDTWTTSMKIQFPVENALTNQLFCVYSKYFGIFQAR